ncbi:PREDICTED: uncharacterized protein LOC108360158 [Rhagoletis zephyria]|uniref:uncharacterized protein LOC108360158 n=1 Tax=Rhagoletis zephyria TaxID=28612 RepID=UPI000811814D|nr:PREDICTED: uncharacterized protein LOC108360158 [Rhagoletis zephyria]
MRNYKVLENDNVFRLPNKTIDGSALPPRKVALQQQFLRACYIAQIWANAHLQVPSGETPSDYGWEEMDNRYQFKWFTDSQLPTSLDEITIQPEKDDGKDILAEISESDSDSDSDDDAKSSAADQSEEVIWLYSHITLNHKKRSADCMRAERRSVDVLKLRVP